MPPEVCGGVVRQDLLEAVIHDFYESECQTFEVPLMEGMEDNLATFRNAMAGIENFIRKHGGLSLAEVTHREPHAVRQGLPERPG